MIGPDAAYEEPTMTPIGPMVPQHDTGFAVAPRPGPLALLAGGVLGRSAGR